MTAKNARRMMAPVEFVAIAGVLALFAGLTVLMVTRDVVTAFIASGITFVAVVMTISMLLLAMTPNSTPEGEKDKPDSGND